jgi:hypothetical protein
MTRSRVVCALGSIGSLVVVAACTTSQPAPETAEQTTVTQSRSSPTLAYRGIVRPPPKERVTRTVQAGPPSASYAPTNGCASPLQYYGGAIVANPEIVQVSWNDFGTTGTVSPSVEVYLQTWWPAIISPQARYIGLLGEYDTVGLNGQDGLAGSNQTFGQSGTYEGLYKITPSLANQAAAIDDTQIGAEVVAQITAGRLPAPTFDANGHCNTIYMIDFPPSVTDISFTFAGSVAHACTDFCGYHMGTEYQGQNIYYGVFPDFTAACPACAPDGLQQDVGMVHSHELAETMTDGEVFLEALTATSTDFVRPGAWDQFATGCSEIGDSCAWPTTGIPTVTYDGQLYYVQGLFDNAHMDCETLGPLPQCTTDAQCSLPTSICDAASLTCRACVATDCTGATPVCDPGGGCRACTATDCTGAAPVCATTGANVGQCVQCDANDHAACAAPTGFCDGTTNVCRGCASSADCSSSTNHVCDVPTGVCVGCMSNSDCSSNACDTAAQTCQQCLNDSECHNPTPVCNGSGADADTCRACASDSECAANTNGHVCGAGSCVACTTTNHSACTGSTPACDGATNTCVACNEVADCPLGDTCDSTTHTCKGSSDGGSGSSGSGSGSSGGGSGGSGSSGSGSSSGAGGDSGSDGGASGGGSAAHSGGCTVSDAGRSSSDLAGFGGLVLGLAVAMGRRRSKR